MEKALESFSKQQLLALVKEHSKAITSHKKELQKSQKELKQQEKDLKQADKELAWTEEKLRKYLRKSGVLEEKVAYLESQLEMFRRMQFGQKRERFEDKDQLTLPFEPNTQELQNREEAFTEKITYHVRRKIPIIKGDSHYRTISR